MSDWSDGFDWSSLFGAGDTGGVNLGDIGGGWTSGQDLPGGGDTGLPTLPGTSFNVGQGQVPSSVYQQLLGQGALQPGANIPAGGGSGGAPGGGKPGLFTNPDGSPNWASILGVVAPLLGGAYTANRTGAANQQMQDAVKQANAQITQTLGGNSELFKPYRDAGAVGLDRLVNMPQSNLSSRYRPLGAGNGFSLGNIAKGQ